MVADSPIHEAIFGGRRQLRFAGCDQRLLEGVIDMHLHAAPCLYERPFDEIEAALQARDAGYRALVLKSIYAPNADRIQLVRRVVPQFEVFGSVVLNHSVGGVNPHAVEAALGFGAKVVWLPTVHARNHIAFFGVPTYPWQNAATGITQDKQRLQPLAVVDEAGKLTAEAKAVVELARAQDAVIGTGHIGAEEIRALLVFARDVGFERVVCTHCGWHATDWSEAEMREMTDLGATLEFTINPQMPNRQQADPRAFCRAIGTIGPEHCIVATDLGQIDNAHPIDGMRMWLRILLANGFTQEDVDIMAKRNPARLLSLEPAKPMAGPETKASAPLTAGIAALAFAFGTPASAEELLAIGAGNPGGSFYQAGSAVVRIVDEHLEGYRATAQTTGGSSTNIRLLDAGEVDVAPVSTNIGAEAWTGTGTFETPVERLRVLVAGYPGANMFVTMADAGFDSIADLADTTVNTGSSGGANAVFARRALEVAAVDFTETNQSLEDAARALGDGRIATFVVQWPSGIVSQLEVSHDLNLLFVNADTLGDEAFATFRAEYPGYSMLTIPEGSYAALTSPTPAAGQFNALVASTAMSDETAYALTAALHENVDTVFEVFPRLAEALVLSDEKIAYSDTPNIPYHPGAIAYYTEQGLEVPGLLTPAE